MKIARFGSVAAALIACAASAVPAAASFADDKAEIQNLTNSIMIAADAQNAKAYGESFARNGELHWTDGVERGPAAIEKAIAAWRPPVSYPPDATSRPRTRQMILNHVVQVNGNTGSGVAYWVAFTNRTPQKDVQVASFGHVEEEYVKEDGKWKFSRRKVYNESLENRALFYPALGEADPRVPAAQP